MKDGVCRNKSSGLRTTPIKEGGPMLAAMWALAPKPEYRPAV